MLPRGVNACTACAGEREIGHSQRCNVSSHVIVRGNLAGPTVPDARGDRVHERLLRDVPLCGAAGIVQPPELRPVTLNEARGGHCQSVDGAPGFLGGACGGAGEGTDGWWLMSSHFPPILRAMAAARPSIVRGAVLSVRGLRWCTSDFLRAHGSRTIRCGASDERFLADGADALIPCNTALDWYVATWQAARGFVRPLINHPGFGFLNANIGNASAGRITTTIVDNRSMQFALKFNF